MSELGIPAKLIRLCKLTLNNTKSSNRQGDSLSCDLFNLLLDKIIPERFSERFVVPWALAAALTIPLSMTHWALQDIRIHWQYAANQETAAMLASPCCPDGWEIFSFESIRFSTRRWKQWKRKTTGRWKHHWEKPTRMDCWNGYNRVSGIYVIKEFLSWRPFDVSSISVPIKTSERIFAINLRITSKHTT